MSQKQKAEQIVESLMAEVSNAIALKCVLTKFAHDERIKGAYNDTYESHAYNLIEGSLVYSLTMCLMRIFDETKREDVNSFRVLFELVVPQNEAANYFGEDSSTFEQSRELYIRMKSSHLLARTKDLRHKLVAHSAMATGNAQFPKYTHLYELLSFGQNIVESLALSVLRRHTDYEGELTIWEKYSSSFFDNLIEGQLNAKKP